MRWLILTLTLPLLTWAVTPKETNPPRRKIQPGTQVSVTKYIEESNAFELAFTEADAVGPNYVDPEDLKAGIRMEGSLKDFIKRILREPSALYLIKNETPLLWTVELKIRAKKAHK